MFLAIAFVYGYNKNKMTVKNAMLNYTCYEEAKEESTTETTASTEPSSSEENTTESTESTTETESNRVLVDEEIATEEVDESQTHIKTSSDYDQTCNYAISDVDDAGNTQEYTYDNNGNVSEITDGRGNTTSYSYDVHSNLLSVANDDSSNTYTYNSRNDMASISHNNFSYNYSYDNYGNLQSVNVGNTALASYTYNSGDTLSQMQYGNGDKLKYTYDSYDRITTVKDESDNILAEYDYNKKGLVTKFTDGKSGETTDYVYDCQGNTMSVLVSSESGTLLKQLTGDIEKTKINGREYNIESVDDGVKYDKYIVSTETDGFGRTTNIKTSEKVGDNKIEKLNLSYDYVNKRDGNNELTHQTTNLVNTMTYKLDGQDIVSYKYEYDANGNITQVKEGNTIIASYLYDNLNQLWSVNYRSRNLYFTYYYDNSGNITSQSIQNLHPTYGYPIGSPETITYTYGDTDWKDKLTSYDGDSITYDNIGNPMSYRDGMIMQWQNGRELASITKNTISYSFKYNLDGLRTQKIKKQGNTVLETVSYNYDSNNNLVGMKKGDTTVLYYYDSDGGLVSMSVEGSGNNPDITYLFVKNLQGDITKILDDSGDVVATYAYDAWGKILAENEDSEVEGLNPFRYRGYTYDPETELYYLQSRYYDPLTGRFLNADSPEYTDTHSGSPLSTNMFAYCENNPISGYDPSGNWDTKDHKKLCLLKNHKFTKLTWSWNLLSDILFNSNDEHSAPFHSRDNLNICKYLFNVAVDFKKTSHKKKKLVEIQISTSKKNKKLKEGYNSDKTKYFIPEKYIAYQSKEGKNSKLEPEYSRTKALIKYLNGKSLSESDKQKIQGKYGIKYKIKNRSDQSKAFLGLALHTVQDHFAHKTYVYYGTKTQVQKYIKNGKIVNDHYLTTTDFNHLKRLGNLSTLRFEDDINKFKWRFKNTKKVTKRLYNLYYGKGYKKVSQYIKNIEKVYYGSKKNIDIYTLNGKKYYFNAVKYKLVVHRDKKRKAP